MDFTGMLLNEFSSLPAYWWLWLVVVAGVVWFIDGRRMTPRPLLAAYILFILMETIIGRKPGVEDLSKVGVKCEEIRTDWFGRRFTFCRDYDGQPIELKEKKK